MSKRQKRERWAIRVIGRTGQNVGRAGEERALKACEHSYMPAWWLGIRRGTYKEDMKEATDCIISTDAGEIRINIKSSLHKNHFPSRDYKGVAVVFVKLNDSDAEIRKKVIDVVARERRIKLEKKKQK